MIPDAVPLESYRAYVDRQHLPAWMVVGSILGGLLGAVAVKETRRGLVAGIVVGAGLPVLYVAAEGGFAPGMAPVVVTTEETP